MRTISLPRKLAVACAVHGACLTHAAIATAGPLLFEEHTERFGAPQPCATPDPANEGCNSTEATLVDLDHDGRLDVLFANGAGFFAAQSAAPLVAYRNDGSGSFVDRSSAWFGFSGYVRQLAVFDADGDGDLDVFAPDAYGLAHHALFLSNGASSPTFVDEGVARIPQGAHVSATRFGDLDADGDLDLVVADWGSTPPGSASVVRVLLNDGTGRFTEKSGAFLRDADAGLPASGAVDVELFDADGDLDLDALVANRVGPSLLFVNDGTAIFRSEARFPPQPGPFVYGPDACDVDGDGDLDVFLDNAGQGQTEQLLINDGHGVFSDETSARITSNPSGVDDNVVRCADVNGDGAFDAVIGSVSGPRRVLINDGTGHFALSPDAFPAQTISTLGIDLGDIDDDHRLDVVTAQGESGSFLNRLYLGTSALPSDTRAPRFRVVERLRNGTAQGQIPVRFAITDGTTSRTGPRLRAVSIETTDASVPARFVGGDLFRAVLTVGNHAITYRACATDWAGNRDCSEPISFLPDGVTNPATDAGRSTADASLESPAEAGVPRSDPGVPLLPAGGCSVIGAAAPASLPIVAASAVALHVISRRRRRRARPKSR